MLQLFKCALIKKEVKSPQYFLMLIFFIIISFSKIYGQDSLQDGILNTFKSYIELPREQVYVHLNKSTYIKGEGLGFKAYVVDRSSKSLSKVTSNLYVTIKDQKDLVIEKQLIKVVDGFADGLIYLDSLFTTGRYQFEAYTNWMRNFNEYNYYTASFNVIDLKSKEKPKNEGADQLDFQLLPEGGHLLYDVKNAVGVVAKNTNGFGISDLSGVVKNQNGDIITDFTTNQFGHAKFVFTPVAEDSYIVQIDNSSTTYPITNIESMGISMVLVDLEDKIGLRLSTNSSTIATISNKNYKLSIHNGSQIKVMNFKFQTSLSVTKIISYNSLYPGTNVITILNEKDQPVLERMYFKYAGIKVDKIMGEAKIAESFVDSTRIELNTINIDPDKTSGFSVSILPSSTLSYKHHHNIISSLFLQPFLPNYVQNASYYFDDITDETKEALDLLLLTEGWSSYDWTSIFNYTPKKIYDFENGIKVVMTIPENKYNHYVLFTSTEEQIRSIRLNKSDRTLERVNLFPNESDFLQIAALDRNENPKKLGFSASFFPGTVPELKGSIKPLELKDDPYFDYPLENDYLDFSTQGFETLKEIIVTGSVKRNRIRSKYKRGEIEIFDDALKSEFFNIGRYLQSKGFDVEFNPKNRRQNLVVSPAFGAGRAPFSSYGRAVESVYFYVDNIRVNEQSDIINLQTEDIDYIVLDLGLNMAGSALLNSQGRLNSEALGLNNSNDPDRINYSQELTNLGDPSRVFIHTNQNSFLKKRGAEFYNQHNFPLTFSPSKKWYQPVFPTYNARFFMEYGAILWEPNLKPNAKGLINITIPNSDSDSITLFFEGIANNGDYLSESKTLKLK